MKAPDANGVYQALGADGLRDAMAMNGHRYNGSEHDKTAANRDEWLAPKPLPIGLAPVAPFDLGFLPESIAPWIGDISDRMQCPSDLVAIPAIVAMGSVIGRKLGIRPQRQTTWLEVPNVWGTIVARPGAMKSPAMDEALKFLKRLEADARKEHDASRKAYEGELEIFRIKRATAKNQVKDGAEARLLLDLETPEEPKARRFTTNDTSYEKLGEILAQSGRGILVVRDELISLLRTLEAEDNAGARGIYQTGWNGTSGYSFDRFMRGSTHVDGVCISVLGAAQPGALAAYVRHTVAGGSCDDGLIQRFGLMVWPDQGTGEWRNVDRWPDSPARDGAWNTYRHLDELTPEGVHAQRDAFETVPFLRFDDAAHDVFLGWRTDLEARLRSTELHPALISHLAKYRKLIPALALINGAGTEGETAAAKAILSRIRSGTLKDGFSARDIYRAAWSNLSDRAQVQAGLDLLADLDWVAAESKPTMGRAKVVYLINPRAHA